MFYRINVSRGNGHVFATADHSLTSKIDYERVLPLIVDKFPESEGYKISCTYWTLSGKQLDLEADLAEAREENAKEEAYRNGG